MIENGMQYVYVYGTHAEEPIGKSDPAFIPRYAISIATRGKVDTRTIALVATVEDAERFAVGYAKALGVDALMLPSAGDVAFALDTNYERQELKPASPEVTA